MLTLSTTHLKAAAISAARQDVRLYLRGVHIEVTDAGVIYTGTDGHRLFTCFDQHHRDAMPETGFIGLTFVIEIESLTKDILLGGSLYIDADQIDGLRDKKEIVASSTRKNQAVLYKCYLRIVDGRYPDYRDVIPLKVSGMPGQFNAKYLKEANDSFELLGERFPRFYANGPSNAGVFYSTFCRAVAIVMPMKDVGSSEDYHFPSWLKAFKPAKVAAKDKVKPVRERKESPKRNTKPKVKKAA